MAEIRSELMAETLHRVPWLSIIVAGFVAFVVSLIGTFLVVSVYAFSLGRLAAPVSPAEKIRRGR